MNNRFIYDLTNKIKENKKNILKILGIVVIIIVITILAVIIEHKRELESIPMRDRNIAPPTQTITKVAPDQETNPVTTSTTKKNSTTKTSSTTTKK